MSKATVIGDALVITSGLTLEQIKTVEKYGPEKLVLKGGEDGKEELFAICSTEGSGEINEYGATFGRTARDGSNAACITMLIGKVEDDVQQHVADMIGAAVIKLNKLEEQILAALPEIEAYKAAMLDAIEVVQ